MGIVLEVWAHGFPATSFEQVMGFLNGDDHDKTKIEIYEPSAGLFLNFQDLCNQKQTIRDE